MQEKMHEGLHELNLVAEDRYGIARWEEGI
jgi:hypothetical protein